MSKLSVTIERHPNQLVTTYHVGQDISSYHMTIWLCLVDGKLAHAAGAGRLIDPELKTVDKRTALLAEMLFAIPSIVCERYERPVSVNGNTLRVARDNTRTDQEVESEVLVSIATAFGLSVDDIDVTVDDEKRSVEYLDKIKRASAHDMAWDVDDPANDDYYHYDPIDVGNPYP